MTAIYDPDLINREKATNYFHQLWNDLNWEHRDNTPRQEYWTNERGQPYTYGRGEGIRTYQSQESHGVIDYINWLVTQDLELPLFEGCFLNGYATGSDALGWHADDDPGIDHARPIVVVSLYDQPNAQGREIHWRNRPTWVERQALGNGSMFVMPAGFQHTHQHKIPRAGFVCRPRISLTFRGLV